MGSSGLPQGGVRQPNQRKLTLVPSEETNTSEAPASVNRRRPGNNNWNGNGPAPAYGLYCGAFGHDALLQQVEEALDELDSCPAAQVLAPLIDCRDWGVPHKHTHWHQQLVHK